LKKTFLNTILILILAGFCTCKKDKNTEFTINGFIIDKYSSEKIANATVELYKQEVSSGTYNDILTLCETKASDNEGKISFTVQKEYVNEYKLIISKDKYFTNEIILNPNDVYNESGYNANFKIASAGYIKVHVKNNSSLFSDDYVGITLENAANEVCLGCCNNDLTQYIGDYVDEYFKCKTYANTNLIVKWSSIISGQVHNYEENVFIKPFDTTNFELTY